MIVQCPSCASKYRVNDANVPSSGGKITCPSCQHKFIVYPEEEQPAQGGGSSDLEDKTSVAFRPDLQKMVSKMREQGAGGAGGGQEEPPSGATEVMSGDSIPDFLANQGAAPPDDGTVEMRNPFGEPDEDVAATEVVSGDMLDNLGFESPGPSQPPQRPQQPQQQQQVQQQQVQQQQVRQQQAQQPTSPPKPQQPAQTPPPASPQQAPQPAATAEPDFDDVDSLSGPDADHDGPWKLKTNFGLTYEFPDTKSLKNWMSSREDLQGYSLSGDGESFHGLDEWPQISAGAGGANSPRRMPSSQPNNPSSPQQPPGGSGGGMGAGNMGGMGAANTGAGNMGAGNMGGMGAGNTGGIGAGNMGAGNTGGIGAGNMGGMGAANTGAAGGGLGQQQPPPAASNSPGKKIEPSEYRPPSRDSQYHWVLWVVALLLTAVAAAIAVQTFGIYDLKSELLGAAPEEAVQEQLDPEARAEGDDDEAPADEQDEEGADPKITQEVDRLLKDAGRAVDNNRLQTASEKLQNAKMLDPERVEVYEMLVEVYTEMGQGEDAERAEEKATELKASLGQPEEAGAEEAEPN
ncbi:MAG: zinc-ribbon domain-containing protein [Persicimonas sp.]